MFRATEIALRRSYGLKSRDDTDFAYPVGVLFDEDLGADSLFEQADMGDHSDGLVVLAEGFKCSDGDSQCFRIKRAEALIDKERVDANGLET